MWFFVYILWTNLTHHNKINHSWFTKNHSWFLVSKTFLDSWRATRRIIPQPFEQNTRLNIYFLHISCYVMLWCSAISDNQLKKAELVSAARLGVILFRKNMFPENSLTQGVFWLFQIPLRALNCKRKLGEIMSRVVQFAKTINVMEIR